MRVRAHAIDASDGQQVRLVLLLLSSLCYGQEINEKEIITYGPWIGYWQQARLSAYSPHDALDREYHESKGERWRYVAADGKTDVRLHRHGIAAPSSLQFGQRVFIPTGHGYLDSSRPDGPSRVFRVDDRGAIIERHAQSGRGIALDLRYWTEYSALAFGVKDAWVFIITGDVASEQPAGGEK